MNKLSNAQVSQLTKLAAENLRALSEENKGLRSQNADLTEKVAHFEKKAHAERIALAMEEKNLQSELSFHEKVARLLERDDLTVFEQAVGIQAPQMKLASVHDDGSLVSVEGVEEGAQAAFVAGLANIDS